MWDFSNERDTEKSSKGDIFVTLSRLCQIKCQPVAVRVVTGVLKWQQRGMVDEVN